MAVFTPKKKTGSRRNCCVPQCASTSQSSRECSFHGFPKEGEFISLENAFGVRERVDRRKKWIHVLRIGKEVSKEMYVCSKHFLKTDYFMGEYSATVRYLKKTAVPSQNLPVTCHQSASTEISGAISGRRERSRSRRMVEVSTVHQKECDDTIEDFEAASLLLQLASSRQVNLPVQATAEFGTQTGSSFKAMRDMGTQVSSGDFSTTIVNVISTERQLTICTGIPTFLLLQTILDLFSEVSPESQRHSMNNRTKIFLTFMKLKLNWSFVVLSIMFGGTAKTCANIFKSTVITLSTILQSVVYWPSKTEISSNLPKCFEKYKKTRVVLDCTEIGTFKSKCLKCRIMSYSHYKGGQTIKYLIGISPAGMIIYISKGYGGRASDKHIFSESGLIDMVDSFTDAIMVDKGFLIKDMCEQFGIEVICPPFLRKKKQFSRDEALATSDIAKARVHVERAIERIKKFKVVSEKMPWKLLNMADDIMVILCGMANLSSPILADDKF